MKRIISILILFNILGLNFVLADEAIVDEFANSTLDKNLKVENIKAPVFTDDFINSINKDSIKVITPKQKPIVDDFALSTLNKNLKVAPVKKVVYKDGLNLNDKTSASYGSIKLIPTQYYTTKNNLIEGRFIDFSLASDIKINDVIYKKGQKVKARVENVSQNGAFGVPADLVLDNFVLVANGKNIALNGNYIKKGADRSLWVYPAGCGLSWFFGLGLLILPIRGGHVKLDPNKVYTIGD